MDHRHPTKVGIVDTVEPVLSDESLKIVDVALPALGVVVGNFGTKVSINTLTSQVDLGQGTSPVWGLTRGYWRFADISSNRVRRITAFSRVSHLSVPPPLRHGAAPVVPWRSETRKAIPRVESKQGDNRRWHAIKHFRNAS